MIEEKDEKECIFCKIASKEAPAEIVYESENFLSFLDINPEVKGHTLIIPKEHYNNILELPESLSSELILTIKKVSELRLKEGNSGFNVIANTGKDSGQIVMHFHIHIIPRKKGDGLRYLTRINK